MPLTEPSILLADDEPAIQRALGRALRAEGYRVISTSAGHDALSRAASAQPDIVLLSLRSAPEGLDTIRSVRAVLDSAPIIALSAPAVGDVTVRALDLGADDYVVMPFSTSELLARVRVAWRRVERLATGARVEATRLMRGPVQIDVATRRAWVRGAPAALTPTQYRLLLCFARHPERVLPTETIRREVWGGRHLTTNDNIRVFVSQLRRQIELDPARPRMILTVPGVGYRFTVRQPWSSDDAEPGA